MATTVHKSDSDASACDHNAVEQLPSPKSTGPMLTTNRYQQLVNAREREIASLRRLVTQTEQRLRECHEEFELQEQAYLAFVRQRSMRLHEGGGGRSGGGRRRRATKRLSASTTTISQEQSPSSPEEVAPTAVCEQPNRLKHDRTSYELSDKLAELRKRLFAIEYGDLEQAEQELTKNRAETAARERVENSRTASSPEDSTGGPPDSSSTRCENDAMAKQDYTGQHDEEVSKLYNTRPCTYRRINHFKEYLRQVQGKSKVKVRKVVYERLRNELKKYRIQSERATPHIVRRMLRAAGLQKFYEHVPAITSHINPRGYSPIFIPEDREEELANMFQRTETPFIKCRSDVQRTRKNFMSYPYVCYKLCELKGWDEYLRAFPLLKSEELLIRQDQWWHAVCRQLNWEFIPTVGNTANQKLLGLDPDL